MQLTKQQMDTVRNGMAVRMTPPELGLECVVVRSDVYDRTNARDQDGEIDPEVMYPLIAEISPEDWEDSSVYGISEKQP
jgi:hypothetical protein